MVKYNLYIYALLTTFIILLIKENDNLKEGLSSCLENVQEKCGSVTSYAITLERENSRLNTVLRQCISQKSD